MLVAVFSTGASKLSMGGSVSIAWLQTLSAPMPTLPAASLKVDDWTETLAVPLVLAVGVNLAKTWLVMPSLV